VHAAFGVEDRDAIAFVLEADDAGRRQHRDAGLRARLRSARGVGAVDHRIRIAEAGAERLADRDLGDGPPARAP
jgi:hypothetical protein